METSSRLTNNTGGCSPLHPVVPNPYTLLSEIPEIFLSNLFEKRLLFSAFGGGKSISIGL